MEQILWFLGRLLFGGYFIFGALNHFTHLSSMAGYSEAKGVPFPKASVFGTGLLLLGGGLSVAANIYPSIGLWALVAFLVPVTPAMHAFWKVQDPMQRVSETINFSKNVALLGASLLILALAPSFG